MGRFRPRDLVAVARPTQYLKNAFVLAPLVFSESVADPRRGAAAALATAAFCLLSSAVYTVNDILDRHADRAHPRKRERPIAAGRLSPSAAGLFAGGLVVAAAGLALLLPPAFAAFAAAYAANSLLYCVWLKHKVIADVIAIAVGFVLRLLAGCAAIDVEPTHWLLVCGFTLALVLGFGKRRTEVEQLGTGTDTRAALQSYSAAKLDALLAVCTAVCLLAYMLYTVAPDTVARHQTDRLVYTTPLVAYGLFRYMFKTQEGKGDGPSEILVRDWVFPATGAAWVAAVLAVLALR